MKRALSILALALGLTVSASALAQDAPPDPVAEVTLDAAPAAEPATTADALPPPIAEEPTTVTDGIGTVTKVARALGSREWATVFFGVIMLLVAGARLAAKKWDDWFTASRWHMLLISVPIAAGSEAARAYFADQSSSAASLVFIALGAALGAAGAWTQRPAAQKAGA
jgi:hypothetical protein